MLSLFHSRLQRALLAVLLGLGIATAAGCTRALLPGSGFSPAGRLEMAAFLSGSAAEPGSTLFVTLSRQGLSRTLQLTFDGESFRGVAEALPVGLWDVTAQLFDAAGDVTHHASATVWVRASEQTSLQLELAPNDGTLEIVADLTGFPDAGLVGRVRASFHNGWTLTLERGEDGRFYGVRRLPPGDYDFSIGLYKSSFYASERVYESPWQSLHVRAGKTLRVVWEASTGAARIAVVVRHLPPVPEGLSVEWSESEALLRWEPVLDPQVTGYRVYAREGEGEPYEKKAEVDQPSWPVPASLLKGHVAVWFVVTSVTSDGRESYRSEAVPLGP